MGNIIKNNCLNCLLEHCLCLREVRSTEVADELRADIITSVYLLITIFPYSARQEPPSPPLYHHQFGRSWFMYSDYRVRKHHVLDKHPNPLICFSITSSLQTIFELLLSIRTFKVKLDSYNVGATWQFSTTFCERTERKYLLQVLCWNNNL